MGAECLMRTILGLALYVCHGDRSIYIFCLVEGVVLLQKLLDGPFYKGDDVQSDGMATRQGSAVPMRFCAHCHRAVVEGIRLVQIITAVRDIFASWKRALHAR